MIKVLVSIVGVAILPIVYTGATTTPGTILPVSGPLRQAPAPLLAAGLPAFMALGGAGAVGAIFRRFSKQAASRAHATADQSNSQQVG